MGAIRDTFKNADYALGFLKAHHFSAYEYISISVG
jgi:hypothetical protein